MVKACVGQKLLRSPSQQENSEMWWHTPVIAMEGDLKQEGQVQVSLGKKRDPISKIPRAKRAGGVAQVVQHLCSKCEALSLSPRTANKYIDK
jgi:hypothetical protein